MELQDSNPAAQLLANLLARAGTITHLSELSGIYGLSDTGVWFPAGTALPPEHGYLLPVSSPPRALLRRLGANVQRLCLGWLGDSACLLALEYRAQTKSARVIPVSTSALFAAASEARLTPKQAILLILDTLLYEGLLPSECAPLRHNDAPAIKEIRQAVEALTP